MILFRCKLRRYVPDSVKKALFLKCPIMVGSFCLLFPICASDVFLGVWQMLIWAGSVHIRFKLSPRGNSHVSLRCLQLFSKRLPTATVPWVQVHMAITRIFLQHPLSITLPTQGTTNITARLFEVGSPKTYNWAIKLLLKVTSQMTSSRLKALKPNAPLVLRTAFC